MDLSFSPEEDAFRAECRAWLEANVPRPALPSGDTRGGFLAHLDWERALFDARLAVVSWPQELGGRDASLWEWLIFEEEYYRAGAPQRVTQNGIFLLAPTIFEYGTPEQQARILPRMASGEQTWCQGWSEPNAGSDLAGIRCRATKVDGGWRLDGQKTWTTRGAFCTHLFGLFRSDPDSERHKGLTYLLVPLDGDGITVRGIASYISTGAHGSRSQYSTRRGAESWSTVLKTSGLRVFTSSLWRTTGTGTTMAKSSGGPL